MTLLHSTRKLMRRAGIETYRANPMTMWELRLPRLLDHHGVHTVLDVGANDGGYASGLRAGGYHGRIVSFEPLPDAWARLRQRADGDLDWSVASRMALSDRDGTADFHESENSVSSSLLDMTTALADTLRESRPVSTIAVPTRKLDSVLPQLDCEHPLYLKLDVQGAEKMVLEGARDALSSAVIGVQLEMSLADLYDGQTGACDLDALLRAHGFECWDMLPGFRDPKSFRMLQYDGVYFRRTAA